MDRILSTLNSFNYNNSIDIIISIDKSNINSQLIEIAEKFFWKHGLKTIRTFEKRQGLKTHIISCGDYFELYDNLIFFEDDIIPSSIFFSYAIKALEFYKFEKYIAGISLYSPYINEIAEKPFYPLNNGYSSFFLQNVESWGQCWNRMMWNNFKEWYLINSNKSSFNFLPEKINSWSDKSWKKYFMAYIVEKNLFFVYPYLSYSSNFSDKGEHVMIASNRYQVPLVYDSISYKFPSFKAGVKYDIYFESLTLYYYFEEKLSKNSITIDLNNTKKDPFNNKYLLSTKILNYKILESYSLKLKPIEMNIIYNIKGNDIFLYDLSTVKINKVNKREVKIKGILYYSNLLWREALIHGFYELGNVIKRRILNKK